MKRRQFILAATSLIALPALAQQRQPGATIEPFRQISPPVPGELRKVHSVISFTCPVCAHYHGMIAGWGNTLPKQFMFDFLPAVTDQDTAIMAMAWLAMQKVAPQKLPLLASSLYSSVQDKGITTSTPGAALWKAILRDVGPTPGFGAAFQAVPFSKIEDIQRQVAAFKIEVTPSIVVGGRFVVTPENTNGNEEMFIQLASAMASKIM